MIGKQLEGLKSQQWMTDWHMGNSTAQNLMPSSARGLKGRPWMTYWEVDKKQKGLLGNSIAQNNVWPALQEALKVSTG